MIVHFYTILDMGMIIVFYPKTAAYKIAEDYKKLSTYSMMTLPNELCAVKETFHRNVND